MRFFYQNGMVTTLLQSQLSTSCVRQGRGGLAIQQTYETQQDTALVATDEQGSLLHTLLPSQSVHSTFSVYGYSPEPAQMCMGFKGERRESPTQHYLLGNGYRAFNPVVMRFNSPDSWSPFGLGGVNAYAFTQGDPVNRSDPSGHAFFGKVRVIQGNLKVFHKRKWHGGKSELRIVSHGAPGRIELGDKMVDASTLAKTLSENGIDIEAHKSHIYSCYSATKAQSTGTSLIEDFARISGKKARGYPGVTVTRTAIFAPKAGENFATIDFRLVRDHRNYADDPHYGDMTNTSVMALAPRRARNTVRTR